MTKIFIFAVINFFLLSNSQAETTKTEDVVVQMSTKGAKCPSSKNVAKGFCPKEKHQQIIEILGDKAADCYSQLFVAESINCSPSTHHSASVPGNTGVGFGICALDKDPGKRSWRGKNCTARDIFTSFQRQVLCCRDIVEKTPRYFGTVNCGHVPNCLGLSKYGTGAGTAYSGAGSGGNTGGFCRLNGKITADDGKNCKNKKIAFMGCRKPDKKSYLEKHSDCDEKDKKIYLCQNKDKTYRKCNL